VRLASREVHQLAATLRRWGIPTLGALARLPRPEVHERLGARGVSWQRWALGEDDGPLVPWMAEPIFEESLELDWPIEGLEPLSFVLARLFEPLADRLERADRGVMAIRTALHLTTGAVHLRAVPLPAPMRDPKTLRTLVLLDLESHPPDAAVDRVHVCLDPTPGRILQWTLFERALPAPEQISTLLARLTALMGEGRVGSPALVETWRPGSFEMKPFQVKESSTFNGQRSKTETGYALRRFRLPIPVRVRVEDGRPVRVTTDRHGVTGGAIVQAAGPWRTSGEWWGGEPVLGTRYSAPGTTNTEYRVPSTKYRVPSTAWDRDEWDIAMADGTIYRLAVEREVGQWFLEGVMD
jgi:protein ImuB